MSAAIFFTWQWGTILDLQYTYIYTKALPDRIFSSVRGSTILRVKPGLQVRIFYLFKMSSKMLISRMYIYIRNRWYFELINYGNISPNLHDFKLNYSICWIRVIIYIYIYMVFCIFNGICYSVKNEHQQFQQFHIKMFIKEGNITGTIGLLEYSICWFHVYIYIYMFWTYGIRLCFMHVIMDHSMHDERNSTSFAHSNGKNRNIWLRFCIEHQTKVIYIHGSNR